MMSEVIASSSISRRVFQFVVLIMQNNRLIAVGDIHGCFEAFSSILREVEYDGGNDKLILIGDYIDRGNDSYTVVSTIRSMQEQYRENVVCIRGNHEQMAIDAYDGTFTDWYHNGYKSTVDSYKKHNEKIDRDIDWFRSLPLYHIEREIIFCHAGLANPLLQDCSDESLLWSRSWVFADDRKREKRVVFGHTPIKKMEPYVTPSGDLCIDSGCVYGGKLSALIINPDGTEQIVSV